MATTFVKHTLGWTIALALVHSGLRAVTGTSEPSSFSGDISYFWAAMFALGALPGGVAASRDFGLGEGGALARLVAVAATALALAGGSYIVADQLAPRLASQSTEPRALTSTEIRDRAQGVASTARDLEAAGQPAASEWQRVNQLAFTHELRIVQALLLPIMGLIGILAGASTRRVEGPWSSVLLWGLGLFLVFAMFMAGENGYELIVLRSAGPMAFVAWLQAVVPGSVLVGLAVATAPALLASLNAQEAPEPS